MAPERMLVLDKDTAKAYFLKKFEVAFFDGDTEIARGNSPELLQHFDNPQLQFRIVFNDYFMEHRKQVGLFFVSLYTCLSFGAICSLWTGIYLLFMIKTMQTFFVFLPILVITGTISIVTGIVAKKTLKQIHSLFK